MPTRNTHSVPAQHWLTVRPGGAHNPSEPLWEGRGYLSEGRRWIESLLALLTADAVPAPLRATALLAGGRLAQWQTHLEAVTTLLRACLAVAEFLDDRLTVAEALVHLGAVRRQGAFACSVLLLERSLELYRAAHDRAGTALALVTLCVTVRFQGDAARYATSLEERLTRFQNLGDLRWIAITQMMLGGVGAAPG